MDLQIPSWNSQEPAVQSTNSNLSHNLVQTTPTTSYEFASFFQRVAAYLFDQLLVGLIALPLIMLSVVVNSNFAPNNDTDQSFANFLIWVLAITIGLFYVSYFVFSWRFGGQTVGNKLFKIKVISEDLSPLSLNQSIRRMIWYGISSFCLNLGYLWMLWDDKSQCWHDKMAGSIVVKSINSQGRKFYQMLVIILIYLISIWTITIFANANYSHTKGIKVENWKTYTNSEYQFSIDYPSFIYGPTKDISDFGPEGNEYTNVTTYNFDNDTQKYSVVIEVITAGVTPRSFSDLNAWQTGTTTIAGQEVKKSFSPGGGNFIIEGPVTKNTNQFLFYFISQNPKYYGDSSLLDQMVATFKFTQ